MTSWADLERLSDAELVDDMILAGLACRADRRETLLEVFRARFEAVTRRAFRDEGGGAALEEGFLDWFWTFERISGCVTSYRSRPRAMAFKTYLKVLARWRANDYFDHANLRACASLADDPPDPSDRSAPEEDDPTLAAVVAATEEIGATYRVPFKLVHFRVLALAGRDWPEVLRTSPLTRETIEAALGDHARGTRATLALKDVAALMGRQLYTIGHYVMLAKNAIVARVARRMEGGPGS